MPHIEVVEAYTVAATMHADGLEAHVEGPIAHMEGKTSNIAPA